MSRTRNKRQSKKSARLAKSSTTTINNTLASESKSLSRSTLMKMAVISAGTTALGLVAYWWKNNDEPANQATYEPLCILPADSPAYNFSTISNATQLANLDLEHLTRSTGEAFTGTFLQLKKMIACTLPYLFDPSVFAWLSEKMSDVVFVLVPGYLLTGSNYHINGVHVPSLKNDDSYILVNTQLAAKNGQYGSVKLLRTLRNEFFHRICYQANQSKTKDAEIRKYPFLNEDGKINLVLKKHYREAIEEFKQNIQSLVPIVKKPLKELNNDENKQLVMCNQILSEYKPKVKKLPRSQESYNKLKSLIKNVNGKKIIPKQAKVGQYIWDVDQLIIKIKRNKDDVEVSLSNYGQSPAEIFLYDWQDTMKSYSSVPAYNGISDNEFLAEIGSHLEEFDPAIKRFFAPKFCQYMAKYIGVEEDDYCADIDDSVRLRR
jgi:hypothetical protein